MKSSDPAPWYHKPLRIAAQHWSHDETGVGAAADAWSRKGFSVSRGEPTGFNTEQLLLHMGSPVFENYLKRAATQGMHIILYLNVHQIKPFVDLFADLRADEAAWERDKSDLWAQRREDGSFGKNYGTQNMACLNSPFRDYFFSQLRRLAPYPVDGIFLDGPSLIQGGCFCKFCRERFRREFGGELAAGTDRNEFDRRSVAEFFNEAYRVFKQVKPDGVSYMNLAVFHPTLSQCRIPEALAFNDIVGTEGGFMFYGPPKQGYLWKPSVAAKMLEAVAPEKPRVIFMAADQKPWNYYQHTPVETQLCIASVAANGASIWYGSMPSFPRLMDRPGVQAACRLLRQLGRRDEYFEETRSAAKVAVMYSYQTDASYQTTVAAADLYGRAEKSAKRLSGNFTESFHGFCDMLARAGIAFDLVTDLDDSLSRLRGYDCLILPTCACLSDRVVAAIRQYVRDGGRLIAAHETSLFDENGRRRPDFGLADVLGVSRQGEEFACSTFNYVQLARRDAFFEGIPIVNLPAPAVGMNVRAEGDAQVLAHFLKPLAGRYDSLLLPPPIGPALVRNRFGKGVSLFLAGTFGEMAASYNPAEYQTLVRNAVWSWARQPVWLEGAIGNMEVVVRRQPGRLIVHVVNYAGLLPRPFTAVYPQAGLRLRVPDGRKFTRARVLFGKGRCRLAREGRTLRVKIPTVDVYQVVVLE